MRREIEGVLFGLFRGRSDESATFESLSDLTGGKYPLLAYIFFLKDMDRFMPIQPTGFDRAFGALGIDFATCANAVGRTMPPITRRSPRCGRSSRCPPD